MSASTFGGLALAALRNLRQGTLSERIKHRVRMRRRHRRETWWNAQPREGSMVLPIMGGRLRLYFDSVLCREIFCGDFEQTELKFASRFLRPDDRFVDVGANIGLFTILAANCVGPSGQVYSFEPVARTFRRFTENVELNGLSCVKAINAALSDRSVNAEIIVSTDGHDAWNSFGKPALGGALGTETVRCVTWDDFSGEFGLAGKVALMKIDVEGWESHVLSGGRQFFERSEAPTLMIEFTDSAARNAGSSCQELFDDLIGLGYSVYLFDSQAHQLRVHQRRDYYDYLNVIATKDVQAVDRRLARSINW
jgi:FkbM family methyltransferase